MKLKLILSYLIFPFILTLTAFWTYFKSRELRKKGIKISPFLWAILVWGLFIPMFPIFLLLKYTKWQKEIKELKLPQKLTQWQRIVVIIIFFAIYVFTLITLVWLT